MIAEKAEHHADERAGAGTKPHCIDLAGPSRRWRGVGGIAARLQRDRVVEVCPNGCVVEGDGMFGVVDERGQPRVSRRS